MRLLTIFLVILIGSASHSPAWAKGNKRPAVRKVTKRKKIVSVPALLPDGRPNFLSASALIVDLDQGEELYAKNAAAVRQIASVGKLFVALTVRDKQIPLAGQTTITEEDKQFAAGGARSRLFVGNSYSNHDLLRAMLVASDNRAVTAVGRAVGLSPMKLVAAVNEKAKALGSKKTKFVDPSGIRGNVSTTREVALALRAALEDPILADILGTKTTTVMSTSEPRSLVQYFSTNLPLRNGEPGVLGGKTGYNDAARYCLAIATMVGEHRIGMVFLGAEGELTRFGDYHRGMNWLQTATVASRLAPEPVEQVGADVEAPTPVTAKLAE